MDQSKDNLKQALQTENSKFTLFYTWLEKHMPKAFFDELKADSLTLITHSLMEFDLQDYFTQITIKGGAFALCTESPDADLQILKQYTMHGIKSYRTFVSNAPLPFPNKSCLLRVAILVFIEQSDEPLSLEEVLPSKQKEEIFHKIKQKNGLIHKEEFENLLRTLTPRFLRTFSPERLVLALDRLFQAKQTDHCQYELLYNEKWQTNNNPSLQIVFAWKGLFKHNFLYRLAKMFHRHNLVIKRVNATYVTSDNNQNILVMSLAVHGIENKAAWEAAHIEDLMQELVTLKHFEGMEMVERTFIESRLLRGNLGNLVKAMTTFIHQTLVHCDLYRYCFEYIEEGLCRYPEITCLLTKAFEEKLHPEKSYLPDYEKTQSRLFDLIKDIDTGNDSNDVRTKNILTQGMHFIDSILKTNFYCTHKTAFCFRLNPSYLQKIPCDVSDKFPALPFAIYFMKGFRFLGFHIRFTDLARGGLRTIALQNPETILAEKNNVFLECYSLAYTQQKKNKDIPEGGAKGVIFLEPLEVEISEKLPEISSSQKQEHMYESQRSYVESLLTLINCHVDGSLKATHVIDYLKKPEYIYLGPDENMHNDMIEWIASYSKKVLYRPGSAFISGKLSFGINHKQFGVTSLGVNVCMEETLKYLGINPEKDSFTVKMTGGPDGDVAGNQMLNLLRYYPHTAKLLTTIDISGVIFDPKGVDLKTIQDLFTKQQSIRHYPAEKLSTGGFLLDLQTKRENDLKETQTLCFKKEKNTLTEQWLSSHEVNHLLRHAIYKTKADVFIPGGGRPRTLNETNVQEFLDEQGVPTAKAIVEGANLYLTAGARRTLEKLGVLILKDSSANKGGVICSSFEVLSGLCLEDEEFAKEKSKLVQEIQSVIADKAQKEARLLLSTHERTSEFLTDISEKISEQINRYTYDILNYLEPLSLPLEPEHPFNRVLLNYVLPTLREKYSDRIFSRIPDIHKKAIISCHIASQLVYVKGLSWSPNITDLLPILCEDPEIIKTQSH
ncbi:MAG: NAD-glutamate dehydrogenase domain-containing protein [Chlamydiota bacterium]